MKVIIKKEHCSNTDYSSNTNCPLCVVLREQYPELGLNHVGGNYVRNENNTLRLYFDESFTSGWNYYRFERLKCGDIQEFVLDIPYPEYDNQIKVKEVIRYISVPCSLTVQSKDLILS